LTRLTARRSAAANAKSSLQRIIPTASMRWTPLLGIGDNEVLELTHVDRSRILNLGYFT
jgi:hypothetical protein